MTTRPPCGAVRWRSTLATMLSVVASVGCAAVQRELEAEVQPRGTTHTDIPASRALNMPQWRALVRATGVLHVRFESTDETNECTAWVVGRHALMTAEHCFRLAHMDKVPTVWSFDPADSSLPTLSGAVSAIVRDSQHDYIVLRVHSALAAEPLSVHPGDVGGHEPLVVIRNHHGMIVVTPGPCHTVSAPQGLRFVHNCNTVRGSSGAPVLALREGRFQVVGLHVAGHLRADNEAINLGRLLREDPSVAAVVRGELPSDPSEPHEPSLPPTAVASTAFVPSASIERLPTVPSPTEMSEPYRRITPPISRLPSPRVAPQPSPPAPTANPSAIYSPVAPQLVGASPPEPGGSDRGVTVSMQLLGFVGGALRDTNGDQGRVSFGGALRVDVAIDRLSPAFIVGAMGGGSADSAAWGEGTISWGPTRYFRIGAGVGAATFDARLDAIASAHLLIAAPVFPGYRQFVGLLGAEIMKGLTSPFVYNHYSLGVGAVF